MNALSYRIKVGEGIVIDIDGEMEIPAINMVMEDGLKDMEAGGINNNGSATEIMIDKEEALIMDMVVVRKLILCQVN